MAMQQGLPHGEFVEISLEQAAYHCGHCDSLAGLGDFKTGILNEARKAHCALAQAAVFQCRHRVRESRGNYCS
jgi:hypothetical protein